MKILEFKGLMPGGNSHIKVTGMLVGTLQIKPQSETNVGVAQGGLNGPLKEISVWSVSGNFW